MAEKEKGKRKEKSSDKEKGVESGDRLKGKIRSSSDMMAA